MDLHPFGRSRFLVRPNFTAVTFQKLQIEYLLVMNQENTSTHEFLSINLNGNHLKLGKNGRWQLESSELDLATLEIEKLVTEKEEFANALERSLEQVDMLTQEIKEINQAKSVLLEMVRVSETIFFFLIAYFS